MESYPRQCRTPEGKSFTENISGNANMTNPRLSTALRKAGNWRLGPMPQEDNMVSAYCLTEGNAMNGFILTAKAKLHL